MTALDKGRLAKGGVAANASEPTTQSEAKAVYAGLLDGALALQSLDDLGSPEANDAAWADMLALESRMQELKRQWCL